MTGNRISDSLSLQYLIWGENLMITKHIRQGKPAEEISAGTAFIKFHSIRVNIYKRNIFFVSNVVNSTVSKQLKIAEHQIDTDLPVQQAVCFCL